ncbi:hypothetical protein B0A49_00295 [Cryomyces minteri]|uniref:FAD/NAD(P)-binding domain-containing protein n=1 Tax=Cryomyces minteri TaxID=331657 RepID=A0A4U0XUH1_9PEZI|nr:hypothetical protein B0A49_00295 [Cryomyces minteri]
MTMFWSLVPVPQFSAQLSASHEFTAPQPSFHRKNSATPTLMQRTRSRFAIVLTPLSFVIWGEEIEGNEYVDFVEKMIVHAKTVEEEGSANAGSKYQCLFYDGHERSHMPAGVLTFPEADKAVADALVVAKTKDATLDERKIAQLDDAGDEGVDIVFRDGLRARAAFLVHKPPTGVVAADSVIELGVDIHEGTDSLVKRNDPFGETNVRGVFVTGDAGTLLE